MKDILIFRTANMKVMNSLINTIYGIENNIYCIVQKNTEKEFKELYPNIKTICLDSDYFQYHVYKTKTHNKIKQIKFESIYIPSSTEYFDSFQEIFKMIELLDYKQVVLYDCYGKTTIEYKVNKNIVIAIMEYIIVCIFTVFFRILYKLKNKYYFYVVQRGK